MTYNIDHNLPLYLSVDASQCGVGGFLYQLKFYNKTPEGESQMQHDLGYVPEKGMADFLLPGVSPGRNTPQVTDFLQNKNTANEFDTCHTLNTDKTMTEKIEMLQNKVIHVRPIAWYSKTFTQGQVVNYVAMEKEFLALILTLMNFRDYIESVPITYVLSDSQPVLWALKHSGESLKLARHLMKLWELNINIVVVHIAGQKNAIADWLSRIYSVEEGKRKEKSELGLKTAQHVDPTFPQLTVVSPDQIKSAFRENSIQPCLAPDMCHLNVNSQLYRGLGPFTFQSSCNETKTEPEVNKINAAMDSLGRFERVLREFLTPESFYKHQQEDPDIKKYVDFVQKNGSNSSGALLIESGILKRKLKSSLTVTIVPLLLVPFVLAEAHWMSHSGAKKLSSIIKLQYWWKHMSLDVAEFVKGCILCSIYKANTKAKTEIGVPRQILRPKFCWQIDICSGLTKIENCQSFLCIVDMYSGYVVPVALKNETSASVALAIEQNIIKPFGVPAEISSDNAANLNGPEVVKLCKFYNINRRLTTPYSPESHGLVEVCNKLLVQLIRIFGDQFKTGWLYVLTLAAVIMNSLPRLSLQEKSPYFLMFNEEPGSQTSNSAELLDIDEYVRQSTKTIKTLLNWSANF